MSSSAQMAPQTMAAPRFTLAMLVWLKPNGAAALAEFGAKAAPLFAKYDLRVERRLVITGKGQIVGQNTHAQPDLIQILSFPSPEAFKAYASDPLYVELAVARDQGIERMAVLAGIPLDIDAVRTPGTGPDHARLYGVGLVRFQANGEAGMDAFNQQAQGLFERHGMHLEATIKIAQIMTPIGEPLDLQADRLVTFFLDNPATLPAYAADPEYKALAPLRDTGLAAYDFFLGKVPAPVATPEMAGMDH